YVSGRPRSAATRHCDATSGRICRPARSANSPGACHRLHVSRSEKSRILRCPECRNRKDRNGTNQARPGAPQEQTFPGESGRIKGHGTDEPLACCAKVTTL